MHRLPVVAAAALLCACTASAGPEPGADVSLAPSGFWDHWGDGRAELAGYVLRFPRYGEIRQGEAVLITVTEDFSARESVKSDRGGAGAYPVLKTNQVMDFQTGVYDYNTMTSTFLRLDGGLPRGTPQRVSLSMQEWCGLTAERVVAGDRGLEHVLDSYFEGESVGPERLSLPKRAVSEDALPSLLRGLTGPLRGGEIQLLPRLVDGRLHHRTLGWRDARLDRGDTRILETPAGAFSVIPWTLEGGEQGTRTWYVGTEPPHVVVGWEGEDGEQARLSGFMRTAYWQEAGEGREMLRAELGLPTRAR